MEKRIGLVLGSFAPPHNGHLSLINFGLSNCDFLYVLLCSHDKEDIPGELRLSWLQEEFKNVNNIKIIHKDTSHMENTSVSNVDISRVWSVYLKDLFPDVNVIFTSEKYGDYVSELKVILTN
jgi:HTH-type transcriptional repressor of NAD biosynthesis genes